MSVPINRFATHFFRTPLGSIDLNINAAGAPIDASVTVPAGFTLHIHSFVFVFKADKFEADGFGPIKGGLTTGMATTYQLPGEPEFLLPVGLIGDIPPGPIAADEYIRRTWEYAAFMGTRMDWCVPSRVLVAQWSASDLCSGRPVTAPAGTIIRQKIADDLSVLEGFRMTVTGILMAETDDPGKFLTDVRHG